MRLSGTFVTELTETSTVSARAVPAGFPRLPQRPTRPAITVNREDCVDGSAEGSKSLAARR